MFSMCSCGFLLIEKLNEYECFRRIDDELSCRFYVYNDKVNK